MTRTVIAAVLLAALWTSGCTTLRPWERGPLLSRSMQAVASPLEAAMDTHVHRTREAMFGAEGAGGVSCGCN